VNSVEWQRAADNTFVGHAAEDTVFRIINTADKRVIVEFGTGFEGKIPPIGHQVRIEYMDTLHVNGRIKTGELRYAEGNGVVPYNEKPSAGGIDFEAIESARSRYPIAFKADRRCVTLGDWEALAALVPGVMQAKAVDLNIEPALPFFMVRLYVIGNGGLVSEALNQQVADALRPKRVNATVFEVLSPKEITTNVRGQIYVQRAYNKDDVLADVNTAISDFYEMTGNDTSEVKLGEPVSYSRLIATIQAVPGVSHLLLTEPESDVIPETDEFVRLDTIDMKVAGVV
jgi:phage-related baseplate assembly protein